MDFKPKFLATAIGSMPHKDMDKALNIEMNAIGDAPIWPQFPKRHMNEQMEIQYSEGMPRRVFDAEKKRMYFDTTGDYSEELAGFYEKYMAAMDPDSGSGDCSAMAISPDFSAGIYLLEKRLKAEGKKRPYIKVQTTGPCSFSLTIVDQDKRAMYYNEEFRDVIVKALAMKCRWQIQKFKPYAANGIICFIDEPILSAFGSSTYVSVKREDVVAIIGEVVNAVHADGGLAGVHCCGNTEWSILMDAGVDIVNFDAFGYGETIALYPDHVKKQLQSGKALAWGVVPTSPEVQKQTVEGLVDKYEKLVDNLVAKSKIDRQLIYQQTVLTPSCGTGSLAEADSEKVFDLLGKLSKALKQKHGM